VGGSPEVVSGILAVQIGRRPSGIRQGVRRSGDQRREQSVCASRPMGTKRRVQNGRRLSTQGNFDNIAASERVYNISRLPIRKRP